ncbi:hypothetical protein ERJ75_000609300 [Trypanosoma vivax]|nr:hypothetical protein ERJ75_000609300 [Trypanosoma vivax]
MGEGPTTGGQRQQTAVRIGRTGLSAGARWDGGRLCEGPVTDAAERTAHNKDICTRGRGQRDRFGSCTRQPRTEPPDTLRTKGRAQAEEKQGAQRWPGGPRQCYDAPAPVVGPFAMHAGSSQRMNDARAEQVRRTASPSRRALEARDTTRRVAARAARCTDREQPRAPLARRIDRQAEKKAPARGTAAGQRNSMGHRNARHQRSNAARTSPIRSGDRTHVRCPNGTGLTGLTAEELAACAKKTLGMEAVKEKGQR